jgi:hypothetical protein
MDTKKRIFLFSLGQHIWVDFHRLPSLASQAWVILYNSLAVLDLRGFTASTTILLSRRPSAQRFRMAALRGFWNFRWCLGS